MRKIDKWVVSSVCLVAMVWALVYAYGVFAQQGPRPIDSWGNDVRLVGSGRFLVAATVSDTVDESRGCSRGFMTDTAGAVKFAACDNTDAQAVTLNSLSPGSIYSISVRRVWSTGTGATVYLIY